MDCQCGSGADRVKCWRENGRALETARLSMASGIAELFACDLDSYAFRMILDDCAKQGFCPVGVEGVRLYLAQHALWHDRLQKLVRKNMKVACIRRQLDHAIEAELGDLVLEKLTRPVKTPPDKRKRPSSPYSLVRRVCFNVLNDHHKRCKQTLSLEAGVESSQSSRRAHDMVLSAPTCSPEAQLDARKKLEWIRDTLTARESEYLDAHMDLSVMSLEERNREAVPLLAALGLESRDELSRKVSELKSRLLGELARRRRR